MESYDEIVKEIEKLKGSEQEMEGLVPVKALVSPNPGVVYSLRLSRDEMNRISEGAKRSGLKVSAFLRMAALAAADGAISQQDIEQAAALERVREKTRELAEAVGQL
jgi:uncharacterized protein (DUF1778 family)